MSPIFVSVNLVGIIRESMQVKNTALGCDKRFYNVSKLTTQKFFTLNLNDSRFIPSTIHIFFNEEQICRVYLEKINPCKLVDGTYEKN